MISYAELTLYVAVLTSLTVVLIGFVVLALLAMRPRRSYRKH